MGWSNEQQAELVRLAAEGLSASLIGARLGATRNAIIGRCYRTGVKLLGCPGRARKPARPRVNRKPRVERVAKPRRARRKHSAEVVAEVERLYVGGVLLREISGATGVPLGALPGMVRSLPRRRLGWSTARKDDSLKVSAVAATLTGEGFEKAAKRLGTCSSSITKWKRDRAIFEAASALADRINAEKAARLAEEAAEREASAQRMREWVVIANATVFDKMAPRHAAMMRMRVSGCSLREVGDSFNITPERVRQIEVRWRFKGLIVPGARELTEASKRIINRSANRGRSGAAERQFPTSTAPVHEGA